MVRIFILPACSLLVNLQTVKPDPAGADWQPCWNESFEGRLFSIWLSPEAVRLN